MVKRIYEHFLNSENNEFFSYTDILNYLNECPEIRALNKKYTRNEGLAKSIREDHIEENSGLL